MEFIPLIVLAVAALLVLAAFWRASGRVRPDLPYTKRPSLLTAGELRFYRVLLGAVPGGLVVLLKVRLMDVVSVPDGAWREYGAPGSGMHLDFVLADPLTLDVRAVIELDDKSHWWVDARKRDAFKNAALASAGIPLLRVRAAGRYDEGDLRARVAEALAY